MASFTAKNMNDSNHLTTSNAFFFIPIRFDKKKSKKSPFKADFCITQIKDSPHPLNTPINSSPKSY